MSKELKEQIFTALGEASMCWSETPPGVFDSERATAIGEKLEQFVKEYAKSLGALDITSTESELLSKPVFKGRIDGLYLTPLGLQYLRTLKLEVKG